MRSILFLNRVFHPDRGATGRCLADLAGRCAAAGWRVTVLADGPMAAESGTPGGVTVVRTGWTGTAPEPSMRGYLDVLRRLTLRGLGLPRHDVVVTMTDPPLLALAGPLLAARHRAALIHWSHDLYPDLLPVLGVQVPRGLTRFVARRTARALGRCDLVLAIGRCMADRLAMQGGPAERVRVLPNWADPALSPAGDADACRAAHGVAGRLVVAYAGNFGLAHPMAGVMAAAARLAGAAPDVLFLMIGEGRAHPAALAAARGLPNVRFLPYQPIAALSELLSAADLHLAVMDRAAEGMLVPCKAAAAASLGRPCLFLGPAGSEVARRLIETRSGEVLDPLDGAELARAILAYRADPALRAAEGRRAAAAAWTADAAAARFLAHLGELARPAGLPAGHPVMRARHG